MNEDILYIWLSLLSGIGPILGTALLKYFNNVEAIYNANYDELVKVDGIGPRLAQNIIDLKDTSRAQKIYDYCKSENIMILKKGTEFYFKKLRAFDKAPIVLYAKGNYQDFTDSVAVVGSRRCTDYGKRVAIDISEKLAENDIVVVSGLAKGIDGYSHIATVKSRGYTIAVIGTGIDICYPKEHKSLADEIIKNGLIISQFPPGTQNVKQNFIRRNETIAMLSDKIVVVQATEKSGAIYTAKSGIKYRKEVFSVPNNIYDSFSIGSNKLLEEGAKVYINHNSIINKAEVKNDIIEDKKKDNDLNITQQEIYEIIENKNSSMDRIKTLLKNNSDNIEEEILELELRGKIKQVAGLFTVY